MIFDFIKFIVKITYEKPYKIFKLYVKKNKIK